MYFSRLKWVRGYSLISVQARRNRGGTGARAPQYFGKIEALIPIFFVTLCTVCLPNISYLPTALLCNEEENCPSWTTNQ